MEAQVADAMTWSIDLCTGFVKVDEVAGAGSFTAVVRHLSAGAWRLTIPRAGMRVDPAVVDSVMVWDDLQLVFDGIVGPVSNGMGGRRIVNQGVGDMVEFTGTDAWGVLARRRVFPVPSMSEPWDQVNDDRTGVASTAAAGYVDANLGAGALAARQIDLDIIDPTVGASGSWSGRLVGLDAIVQRVCREGGIVCYPRFLVGGTLQVRFASPVDRSATIVLSDQGDLVDLTRRSETANPTWVLAAGQGQGTSRLFESADSGATGLARFEALSEQASATSSDELNQIASTGVLAGSGGDWVSTKLTATAAQRLQWLVDYDVGDLLAVEVENVRFTVPVTAVEITVTPDRADVVPSLGEVVPDRLRGLNRDVLDLAARFDNQID